MPRVDALTRFFNKVALVGAMKSDILPLKAARRDIAVGGSLFLYVHALGAALADAAGGDSVATVSLETDDAEAFGSGTIRQTIGTFTHGDPLGKVLAVVVSPGVLIEAFCRLDVAVANGNFDGNTKLYAYLSPDPQLWYAYSTPIGPKV